MSHSVKVSIDAPGVRLRFSGSHGTWERDLLPLLGPLGRGRWKEGAPVPPDSIAGPADPHAAPVPGAPTAPTAFQAAPAPPPALPPAPASNFAPSAPSPAAPAAPPRPATPAPGSAASWDPNPLYQRLLKEEGRKAERDAVLVALVSLAVEGRRDVSPAEVLAHMEKHGYPSKGVKAKPVLAKLCHRKGMAVPGVLPNTFRATPSGSAYVWKRARGA